MSLGVSKVSLADAPKVNNTPQIYGVKYRKHPPNIITTESHTGKVYCL